AAEVRFDVARTYVRRLDAVEPAQLGRMYAEMTRQATEVVRESAVAGEIAVVRSVDARYVGQGYELTVPVPPGELDAGALGRVRAAFDEVYAARYGYANPREPVEVVTWKLSAVGGSPRIALAKAQTEDRGRAVKGSRRAYFPEARGYVDTPVYDRYALAAGARLTGPAIVEERESTTVLPPGATASVDEYANLIVEVVGTAGGAGSASGAPPVFRHDRGNGVTAVLAIQPEVPVEGENAAVRVRFGHADEAGVGERHRHAGVTGHQPDRAHVVLELEGDPQGAAAEELEHGARTTPGVSNEKAGLGHDRLAGQERHGQLGQPRRCPPVMAIAPVEEGDERARVDEGRRRQRPYAWRWRGWCERSIGPDTQPVRSCARLAKERARGFRSLVS